MQLFAMVIVELPGFACVLWVVDTLIFHNTISSICLVMPGQNTVIRALALVFSMPQWLICNFLRMSFLHADGMTSRLSLSKIPFAS